MKKILIIGAGFLQSFIIKKAKAMGYHTIAIDKKPDSLGFKYADEYKVIDIIDKEACLAYAISKNIDGVLTGATDYGVLSSSYIAQEMKLPGLNYKIAEVIKNKYLVRNALFENKVDDLSQYYEVESFDLLKEISDEIKFPVMVKPSDGSGSKAAKRVNSIEGLKSACEEAMKSSIIGKALIEDFIEGEEFGVESFVYNGEIYVLGVMEKYMTPPPNYAELGHAISNRLSIEDRVEEIVKSAIKVLGVNFGAVNMDILVTKNNQISIIDVGARMGGNLIGSHIIPLGTDIDYIGVLIRAAVGDLVKFQTTKKRAIVATRILALKSGKVKELPNFKKIQEEFKVEIYHHLKKGTEIREYQNNLDGLGYIVSKSDDIELAIKQADMVREIIDISIVRE